MKNKPDLTTDLARDLLSLWDHEPFKLLLREADIKREAHTNILLRMNVGEPGWALKTAELRGVINGINILEEIHDECKRVVNRAYKNALHGGGDE